ncbi:MAG: hypothetical protein V7776_12645 [Halopseudomonas aestusnigri]
MNIKPTLKLRILLALFTLFIGAHAFIMQGEIGFYIRNLVQVDIDGIISIDLDRFTIEFLVKVIISLALGMLVLPRFIKEPRMSHWDKFMFSFFIFLFLVTFFQSSILQMLSPGSIYLYDLGEALYFAPLLLIGGIYIMPRFLSSREYKPWRAFLGGISVSTLILPFVLIYDAISLYPSFLNDAAQVLEKNPKEDHFFIFIGYFIREFLEYPPPYYWSMLTLPISGVSAWVAQFYLYRHRETYWKSNLEIFD